MSSKTRDNLLAAFAGESQARNKYTFFAKVARKEGLNTVADIFEEAAENEKKHAEIILRLLKGIGDTKANLKEAINGETHEFESMYPEFLEVALEEGQQEAARYFKEVINAEEAHAKRFATLLKALEEGTLTADKNEIEWRCRVCGYIHVGKEAPGICPLCDHPKEFYEKAIKEL